MSLFWACLRSSWSAAHGSSSDSARTRVASSWSLAHHSWRSRSRSMARPGSSPRPRKIACRRVLDQIFICPTKLFERWLLVIAWVDGFDGSDSQQLREGLGVIVIGLVAVLDQLVVAWIADRDRRYQGLDQLMEPGGMGALFKD